MQLATRSLTDEPLRIDVEGDGVTEDVEIVEVLDPGFSYPLLARWTKPCGNTARRQTVWAVASHFHVHGAPVADLERGVLAHLGGEPLQYRTLPMSAAPAGGGSFRVGPTPSTPAFRRLTEAGTVLRAVEPLRALGAGVRVEPDYLCFVDAAPNDKDFALLQQTTMARIGAPAAWDLTTGRGDVVVAIVDTGIDLAHPDLAANLRRGAAGEVLGWNFVKGDPDPADDHWHGTYCAGLVGAAGNNGIGMAGVNWQVSLLPVKAFNAAGVGTSTHAAAAIRFAADQGADVILCAWGSAGRSSDVKAAIEYAGSKGILVVAAAGNTGVSLDDAPHFPASFAADELPNLISVSATDNQDKPLPDAATSPTQVHLSAPGERVYSTFPTRLQPFLPYHLAVTGGTSAAAALVAGGCALLMAHAKRRRLSRSHLDIRDALLSGVDTLPGGLAGISATGGRLNLSGALGKLGERRTATHRSTPASSRRPPAVSPPVAPVHAHP